MTGIFKIPLNSGTALHTVIGPRLAYCPKASSINNSGIPHVTNIIMYGMKNAPEIRNIP